MRREKQNLFFVCLDYLLASVKLFVPIVIGIFLLLGVIFPVQAEILPLVTIKGQVKDVATDKPVYKAKVMVVQTWETPDCLTGNYTIFGCWQDKYVISGLAYTDLQGKYIVYTTDAWADVWLLVEAYGYDTYQVTKNYTNQIHTLDFTLTKDPSILDPVLIIPGIMASWNRNLLDKNLEYADEWELDPHFHTYDGLIADLQNYGGYELGKNLFTFPYDWRRSNHFTAQLLYGEIQKIKNQTGSPRVDLVAHSMGGLVARYYIVSNLYQNDVDQLIFIATPQRGAPKAYLAWEGGYLGTTVVSDFVKELLIAKIAKTDGYCDSILERNKCIYNYVHGYPVGSLQQLLPDYNYLQSSITGEVFSYPFKHPYSILLSSLNAWYNLDKFYNSGVEVSTIYSSVPNSTVGMIQVTPRTEEQKPFWYYGYPDGFSGLFRDNGIEYVSGDETVPYSSATFISSENQIAKLNVKHLSIVNASSKNVLEILKNEFIDIQVIDQPDEYVIIQVHSPVDILVTTPSGKKIGFNAQTDIDTNEIPGAYYTGAGADNEYILIPGKESGNYKLDLIGTGEGEYQVDISLVKNNEIISQTISSSTQIGEHALLGAKFDQGEVELVDLTDITPPQIQVNSPQSYGEYEQHLLVPIDITVTDEGSGVGSTEIYLDGEIYHDTVIDLFSLSMERHDLLVVVTDLVGNINSKEIPFWNYGNFNSLRGSVDRLFQSGDIINQVVKDKLLLEVDWLYRSKQLEKLLEEKNGPQGEGVSNWRTNMSDYLTDKLVRQMYDKGLISLSAQEILLKQFYFVTHNIKL